MNNETRLQEIERQLAELKSVSYQRAGQLELPLDPTTQALLVQAIIQNASQVTSSLIPNEVHGRQVFTSSGDFTLPSGVRYVDVEIVGGGAGGAVYNTSTSYKSGGGGAYVKKLLDLNGVSSVSVTIGSGGSGADTYNTGGTTYYTNAVNGGATSFGSYISANGGIRGDDSAAGGTASGGDVNIDGKSSGNTVIIFNTSSSSDDNYILPASGDTFLGFGAPAQWISYNTEINGADGIGYGTGGACGKGYTYNPDVHYTGGEGKAGVVIVTY